MRAVHLLVTACRTEPFIQSLCVADMWIWHIDMEVYFITPSDCQAPCRLGVDWTDDVQASVCSFSWQTAACLTRSETSRTHKTTYERKTKIVPWFSLMFSVGGRLLCLVVGCPKIISTKRIKTHFYLWSQSAELGGRPYVLWRSWSHSPFWGALVSTPTSIMGCQMWIFNF